MFSLVLTSSLLHGRWPGPSDAPSALETEFGWVLARSTSPLNSKNQVATHHATVSTSDEILQRFWQLEEVPPESPILSSEEAAVMSHFNENHYNTPQGRFVVTLPRHVNAPNLGESRSRAVRRFLSLEKSLHSKN